MKIDIVTFLTRNSAAYAEYLKYTCEKYMSGKHQLYWKCIQSVGSKRIPDGYKFECQTGDVGHNSSNHAQALNEAYRYVDHDIAIYVDSDMAVLYPGWDDVVVKELERYHCFGTAYDDPIKYQNFPMVYFFAFRSEILNTVYLDFRPDIVPGSDKPVRFKLPAGKAEYFGKKPGEIIKCDTGWKIPEIMKKAGFTGSCMKPVPMTSKYSQLPFENEKHKNFCMQKPTHHCEWLYNGRLFTTHKQASRNHPINGRYGKAWRQRVDAYIRYLEETGRILNEQKRVTNTNR